LATSDFGDFNGGEKETANILPEENPLVARRIEDAIQLLFK
jgi:hypothetical protein